MRKIVLFLLILIIPANVLASDEAGDFMLNPPEYTAGSVLVLDARTSAVLFESEGRTRRYPASITKIMTALLVIENVEDLNERIIISENAVDLPDYAGRMGMEAGESITVLDALYGLMLPSANDIARALAEHVSGNIPDFVTKMNLRAEEIGATETRFINPCGLPGEGQFTTAYDIALIKREAIQNPLYVEIIGTPLFDLPPTNMHEETRQMTNSNVMVRPWHDAYNPYVVGGKTGFTNAAQHTLVTYAKNDKREVIISVLFATPRGAIFADTASLIDYIFYEIPPPPKIPEGMEIVRAFAEYTMITPPPEKDFPKLMAIPKSVNGFEAMSSVSIMIAFTAAILITLALVRKKYYN